MLMFTDACSLSYNGSKATAIVTGIIGTCDLDDCYSHVFHWIVYRCCYCCLGRAVLATKDWR